MCLFRGYPSFDSRELFECLCYQGFQAGLSWTIICSKLSTMKKAFSEFDYNKIIKYKSTDIERLMQDTGIIRNRSKIESVINNARIVKEIEETEDGGFAAYIWKFKPIYKEERYIEDKHRVSSHMRTDMQLKPKDRLYSDGNSTTLVYNYYLHYSYYLYHCHIFISFYENFLF